MDDWRRENDYALLVGPLSQFPSNRSQIYVQAIERNVTLLSYVHLTFLLEFYSKQDDIQELWKTGRRLFKLLSKSEHKSAIVYWSEIDRVVCQILAKTSSDLREFKEKEKEKRNQLGFEGIKYWENKIKEYNSLTKEDAIKRLIKADKIEEKIEQIQRAINREYIV